MVESEFPAIHGEYRNTAGEWLRIVPVVSRGGLMTLFGLVVLVVAALVAAGGEVVNAIVSAAFGLSLVTGWYCVPFVWWSMRGRRDVFEARQVLEATAEELRLTSDFGVFSYKWSSFRPGGREMPMMFLIQTAGKAKLVIPKRAFSQPDLVAFRRLLQQRLLIR